MRHKQRRFGLGSTVRRKIKIALLIFTVLGLVACGSVANKPPSTVNTADLSVSPELKTLIQNIKFLAPSFVVEVRAPFVITGDLDTATLNVWAGRIQRTRAALKKQFFEKEPAQAITIWLFKNSTSYQHYNQTFWSMTPPSVYGYYQPRTQQMVMNIATGGGTLTHELVHPYMQANFPDTPLWFNEGLASLYERASYRLGNIIGMNNWRLSALQAAHRSKTLVQLREMMTLTDQRFYRENRSLNYAQARYLLFYLQEKGLLRQFYQTYRDSIATDPHGIQSLLKVTQFPSMMLLEADWRQFIMQHKAPR